MIGNQRFLGTLGGAMVALLAISSGAHAAGSSMDGVRGLLRVHSADTGVPGYVAGSLYGTYAREFYSGALSPRGRSEEVKFGGGIFSLGFTPNRYVELGLRGTVESQFVSAVAFDESDSQIGLGQVALNVKSLLTPADSKAWQLGAERSSRRAPETRTRSSERGTRTGWTSEVD
jgi:hypothetical protein